jgi:lysosomal-associated membrane protein 1/2
LIHFYKRINAMEAHNLLVLIMLGIIGANAAEDVSAENDSAIMKNQTEEVKEIYFHEISNLTADQGNWTVGDCIIVKMAAQLTLSPDKANANSTITLDIPVSATVSSQSSCLPTDSNTTQLFTLEWSDKNPDDVGVLNRNLTLHFSLNQTSSSYGVSKISAVYEHKTYVIQENKTNPDNTTILVNQTVLEYISMSTFAMSPWEFLVPENRSYLCMDVGSKSMISELHKSTEPGGSPGERLSNATLTAKRVQFDAFRSPAAPPNQFQLPSDCSYRPNDIVPIIVGCALAGMVLMVLVAYTVGRRRSRARGYMSV